MKQCSRNEATSKGHLFHTTSLLPWTHELGSAKGEGGCEQGNLHTPNACTMMLLQQLALLKKSPIILLLSLLRGEQDGAHSTVCFEDRQYQTANFPHQPVCHARMAQGTQRRRDANGYAFKPALVSTTAFYFVGVSLNRQKSLGEVTAGLLEGCIHLKHNPLAARKANAAPQTPLMHTCISLSYETALSQISADCLYH